MTISVNKNTVRSNKEFLTPPSAEKIKKELTWNSHTRVDYYYWLNEIDNPKVIEYLKAENEYTNAALSHTKNLQDNLYSEMVGRIKQEDESVPYKDNGYYYYSRYEKGNEYPIYYRKKETLEAPEEILLNVNEMAKGFRYFDVMGISVSPDNKYLAYGVDSVGRRKYEIHFKNLVTGEILPDKISRTTGNVAWLNNSMEVFYSKKDRTLKPYKIFKHKLGEDISKDVEIYHEKDLPFAVYVFKTKSKKFILIGSFSNQSTEYRYLDADDPSGKFKMIEPRAKEVEYYVDHHEDQFFIMTNYQAINFRLMETEISNPSKDNWKEIIPHRENVLLEGIEVFKDHLVLQERKNGLREIRTINLNNNSSAYINFEEKAYSVYLSNNREYNSDTVRYVYTSLTTPNSTFDFNMISGKKMLLKEETILGNFDKRNYTTERLYAAAKDGVKVPISVVYKKGLIKNSDNPLLLTGYGSYGISSDADFNSVRLSLIDRGFVYAIAHVRGGQEMGRQWYQDGKLLNKKNTFEDFTACAEHLIEEKFTNPKKLFAMGGSAGGMLMGAVANTCPDLFKGIIAAVPFVDVLTTMLDDDIPLTTGEYEEWGNPKEKEYYDYIFSYSPYDNVERKKYPAMLVTTGLHDSQVQYWEPAKWVAKLRDMKTDDNLLLLHTNMSAGHGGSSGRFERYKVIALEYAFILDQINNKE